MIENPLLILNQYGVAITPDEKYLYIVNNQYYGITPYDSVYLYDLINEQFISKITHLSFKTPSTATISGRRVYITNSNSTTISIIDTVSNQVINAIDGFNNPYRIVVSADGKTGYVCNYGDGITLGTLSVVNLEILEIKKNIQVGVGPCSCALSPDGKKLCVVNYISKFISIIDTTSLIFVKTVPLDINVGNPFNINIDANDSSVNCYILSITGPIEPTAIIESYKYNTHISIIDLSTNTLLLPYSTINNIWYGIVFPINKSLKQIYILSYNRNTKLLFIDINQGIPELRLIQYKNLVVQNEPVPIAMLVDDEGNEKITFELKLDELLCE